MMMETMDTKPPREYEEATAPPDQGVRVRLNVGGQKFATWSSTLAKLAGTRLFGLTWQDPAYDQEEKEYFFDRNPWLFPYVLDAYHNGEVHFPESVCAPAMQAELLHWGLSEQLIPTCCWKTFNTWAGDQETSALVDASLKPSSPTGASGWRNRMNFVWRFLDDARSSKFATVWMVFYTLLLVLSLVVIIVSTCYDHTAHTAMRNTNIVCSFIFFIELLIRFAACPKKCRFFCSAYNIIDILHTLPMFIYCCVSLALVADFGANQFKHYTFHQVSAGHEVLDEDPHYLDDDHVAPWVTDLAIALLAISTFFRAVRVLKIATLSWKTQVLWLALRVSVKELLMLLVLESVFMVAFGSAVYFSEKHSEESHFRSIPDGMWWSIVTLTTVGYGDSRPISRLGKVVGGACALCSIVLVALAVSIVVNNFRQVYTTTKARMRINQRAIAKKMDKII